MNISVVQMTDVNLAVEACSFTINKPSTISLSKLAQCEHSPLRTIMFKVCMYDIPSFVSTHLVRHSVGVEHFVKSNRIDRGGDKNVGRWTPVNHMMFLNAQALINISLKRLCFKASIETTNVMKEIKKQSPDWIRPYLVPMCEYRNGCNELKSCGYYE